MNFPGALLGGILGAILGSAVWVAIGYFTGYEFGILAIGVGLTCGVGVAMGAKGRTGGTPGGILAGALTLVAIVAARFVILQLSLDQYIRDAAAEIGEVPGPEDSVYWTDFIAQQIEGEAGYEDYNWPDEEAYEDDIISNDYPIEIWTQASQQWSELSATERAQFCEAAKQSMSDEFMGGESEARIVFSIIGVLVSNLHPMALLMMGLAIASAFKVAASARPVGDPEAGLDSFDSPGEGPRGLPGMPLPTMRETVPSKAGPQDEPASRFGLPGMPPPGSLGGSTGGSAGGPNGPRNQ